MIGEHEPQLQEEPLGQVHGQPWARVAHWRSLPCSLVSSHAHSSAGCSLQKWWPWCNNEWIRRSEESRPLVTSVSDSRRETCTATSQELCSLICWSHEIKSESKWIESRSVVSHSLRPHGLNSPWNSPGQNTGVGSLSLLQRIFPTQGSNPSLPHCRQILYQLSHKGSPL